MPRECSHCFLILRQQIAEIQGSKYPKAKSIIPVLMATCKKIHMGYIFREKICKDAENLGKPVVWGGKCVSQEEH